MYEGKSCAAPEVFKVLEMGCGDHDVLYDCDAQFLRQHTGQTSDLPMGLYQCAFLHNYRVSESLIWAKYCFKLIMLS